MLTYPITPGAKAEGPSADAARSVDAHTLRTMCHHVIRAHGSRTADEIARVLGVSILSIRPRLSELRALGLVEDSGDRRKNISGRKATVWRMRE